MQFPKLMTLLFLASTLISVQPEIQARQQARCVAPELHAEPGAEVYNSLVCRGIALMQSGNFKGAADSFSLALQERLGESPNYKLFTRLALAYFKAGEQSRAREALEKAELSLSVAIGAVKCKETGGGFSLVEGDGRGIDKTLGIELVMCGQIFEDSYAFRTLRTAASDGDLINAYFAARNQILAGPRLSPRKPSP